ncbi:MAG: cell division protein FtsW [Verrucomicrobia bacterium]|nr:cell division protein FtsW [Verrucomicrobiota bacterium]
MRFTAIILVIGMTGLTGLGMVTLSSAGLAKGGSQMLLEQVAFALVGLTLCGTLASIDYRSLKPWILPLWVLTLGLLVAVFFFDEVKGAHRWIRIGRIGFQPSEVAKVVLILLLAQYVEAHARFMNTFHRGLLVPGLFIGLTLGLIFVEPDRGTTALMAGVTGAMLIASGVRGLYLVPVGVVGLAGFVGLLLVDPVRYKRIMGWLHPELYRESSGYQAWQAMLALGAGGWNGVGLGEGRQKLGWVPEHQTDFIFSVVGEELGLVATLLVLATYVVMVVCGLAIAANARDTFGKFVAAGVSFLFGLQAFINIGVVTSVLPNKGIALPFVSKGGSNLVMMMACVGLLLSVARLARLRGEESS